MFTCESEDVWPNQFPMERPGARFGLRGAYKTATRVAAAQVGVIRRGLDVQQSDEPNVLTVRGLFLLMRWRASVVAQVRFESIEVGEKNHEVV